MIHIKFNLSDTHISWKGYLIGSLTPKINIHLMAYKKKQTVRRCLPSKIPCLVVIHLKASFHAVAPGRFCRILVCCFAIY